MAYDFEKWVANDRKLVKRNPLFPYFLAAMMVAMAATGVAEIFDTSAKDGGIPNTGPFALAIITASLGSPFARDAWIGPRVNKILDEFERDALSRATARSYSVMIGLLLLLFGWLWLASDNGWPIPRTPLDWSAVGLAVVGIGGVLPIFFAEIMVPLPPADDVPDL